ncbi:MAG TPA: hypothetical protein VL442_06860 [Mucilaginibacter sp.]|jgi:hypothetical protein|nr:hypothetical protein [Mucilaginibacter sp.]
MREIEPPFEIELEGITIKVSEQELKSQRVFYIDFSGWKKNLVITVAEKQWGDKFWTSIPEGRQQEAEQIGKLIANFIRSKRKG